MNQKELARLLFPHPLKTPPEWEAIFPHRGLDPEAKVTRLGPSPTGFIHLGNLYGAFVDERLAHQSNGVFYLRIEDTDDKRLVAGAVPSIIGSLAYFGIAFDEGATLNGDVGNYGPYYQSRRREIYHTYVRDLVTRGLAYPCFLTEDEIAEIRRNQEASKANPGIYGVYAAHRNLPLDDVKGRLKAGQPYTIRLRSQGDGMLPPGEMPTFTIEDGIRGSLTMPVNCQDIVLLKAGGMPTYHLAHVVDDHLMGTTHVIRGEEWLSSLPIHVELFGALGFFLPVYCHTAQLMKLDENGNKRKLSKRKDPELSLDYYREQGYHPSALREYLLTLINSDFEEWRIANPEAPDSGFLVTTEKMSSSGSLFDINKLNDISKEVLGKIPAPALYDFMLAWAGEFRPDAWEALSQDRAYVERILDLGRGDAKPRKDFIRAGQMFDFIRYFFDDFFVMEEDLPPEVSTADATAILEEYLKGYGHNDDQSQWFSKIRDIGSALGYAAKPKDYKKNPQDYKGHVGHVSTVIRLALVGRSQSPDLWEIQQILGEQRSLARLGQIKF